MSSLNAKLSPSGLTGINLSVFHHVALDSGPHGKGLDLLPSPTGHLALDTSDNNSLSGKSPNDELRSPPPPPQLLKSVIGMGMGSPSDHAPILVTKDKDLDGSPRFIKDGKIRGAKFSMNQQDAFVGSQEELSLLSSAVELLSGSAFMGGMPYAHPMSAFMHPMAHFPTAAMAQPIAIHSHHHAHHAPPPPPPRTQKRSRDDGLEQTKTASKPKAARKEAKLDRFFWDNELHNCFLEAIFRLGLMQERPMELYVLFSQSGGAHANFTVDDLNAQCGRLRENVDLALKVLKEQLHVAYRHAPICTNINEKKGGHPAFHVYPFPYGDVKVLEDLVGCNDPDYTRRFMAAVFDLGLQYARPKSIFKLMQPSPEKMTTGSVKSHLQKYRTNSKATREMFINQFRSSERRQESKSPVTDIIDNLNNFAQPSVNQQPQQQQALPQAPPTAVPL